MKLILSLLMLRDDGEMLLADTLSHYASPGAEY